MLRFLCNIFNLRGSLRGDIAKITNSSDIAPIPVNGAVTVYSRVRDCRYFDNIGVFLQLSGSTPQITITIEQSAQPVAAANINASDPQWAVGAGVAPICTNLTTTTPIIQTLSLVPMKLFRAKIVGGASNGSDTVVDLRLFEQEFLS